MTVRIVYDGVACAGKTTNLRHLSASFAASRVGQLGSAAEIFGRTLYFDWLRIEAGVVCGIPLSCQVVSVPGQSALTPRRRALLASADVVVYVCDSHPSSIAASRAALALHDRLVRERSDGALPIVVQANKQDVEGALGGLALTRALGRTGAPVVEAIASDGIGVVDSFVTAVRTVARTLTARVEARSLDIEVRRAERPSELLARIAKEALDPASAAELFLEEAEAAFMLSEAVSAVKEDGASRRHLAASVREVSRACASTPHEAEIEPPAPEEPLVPFPSADVPTGFIWPAHTGRAIVRRLELPESAPRPIDDETGLSHVVADHVVRTSRRARFADGEQARQALVRIARTCAQLGRLHVPETVLVAQAARDGACFIWSVRPDLPSVTRLAREGLATAEVLSATAVAMVEAMRIAQMNGFSLELSFASFGVQRGMPRYLGDVWPAPPVADDLSSGLTASLGALERLGADVKVFADTFEREMARRGAAPARAREAT